MPFSLSATLDKESIAAQFHDQDYVSIRGVLVAESAQRLLAALQGFRGWTLVTNDRGKHVDLSPAQQEAMQPETRKQLMNAVYAQATGDFQYFYHNYPIYDAHRSDHKLEPTLHEFYEWLDGEDFLGFARAVTGFEDIRFADAQATRYGPGHFLTLHDDSQEGKNRRIAYVFNFTPNWRPDWGGYLQLLDADGHIRRGLCPQFNTLNLLAVPQRHSVGLVAPFAGAARYSITGWLRSGEHPDDER